MSLVLPDPATLSTDEIKFWNATTWRMLSVVASGNGRELGLVDEVSADRERAVRVIERAVEIVTIEAVDEGRAILGSDAARAGIGVNPTPGDWVEAVRGQLRDPDGLMRYLREASESEDPDVARPADKIYASMADTAMGEHYREIVAMTRETILAFDAARLYREDPEHVLTPFEFKELFATTERA